VSARFSIYLSISLSIFHLAPRHRVLSNLVRVRVRVRVRVKGRGRGRGRGRLRLRLRLRLSSHRSRAHKGDAVSADLRVGVHVAVECDTHVRVAREQLEHLGRCSGDIAEILGDIGET